jgi:hypothetical protein
MLLVEPERRSRLLREFLEHLSLAVAAPEIEDDPVRSDDVGNLDHAMTGVIRSLTPWSPRLPGPHAACPMALDRAGAAAPRRQQSANHCDSNMGHRLCPVEGRTPIPASFQFAGSLSRTDEVNSPGTSFGAQRVTA